MRKAKKKLRIVGGRKLIDSVTGEVYDSQIICEESPEADAGFYKIFMRDFIRTLELVASQKERVCYWIIDNLNKDNQLIATYKRIQHETGASYDTVAKTMKILIDNDFLRKCSSGVYVINPNIIWKGSHARRMNVLHTYQSSEEEDLDQTEGMKQQLESLEKSIEKLMCKADSLRNKIHAKTNEEQSKKEGETA